MYPTVQCTVKMEIFKRKTLPLIWALPCWLIFVMTSLPLGRQLRNIKKLPIVHYSLGAETAGAAASLEVTRNAKKLGNFMFINQRFWTVWLLFQPSFSPAFTLVGRSFGLPGLFGPLLTTSWGCGSLYTMAAFEKNCLKITYNKSPFQVPSSKKIGKNSGTFVLTTF